MSKNLGQAKIGLVLVAVVFSGLVILSLTRKNSDNNSDNNFSGVSPTSTTSAPPTTNNGDVKSDKLANNYFVFTKEAYETAKIYKQPIFLFFYSALCSTCVEQDRVVIETFNNLGKNNVIGFRINYDDDDTSQDEKDLAKEFGVKAEHTILVLDKEAKQTEKFLGETAGETIELALNRVNTIR